MFLLTPSVSSNFNGSTVTAPNCAILTNGTANFNGATVAAKEIGYAGLAPNGGTFPDAQPTPMLPVADPCPEIAGCAYLKANPPPTGGCSADATYTDTTVPAGLLSEPDI